MTKVSAQRHILVGIWQIFADRRMFIIALMQVNNNMITCVLSVFV